MMRQQLAVGTDAPRWCVSILPRNSRTRRVRKHILSTPADEPESRTTPSMYSKLQRVYLYICQELPWAARREPTADICRARRPRPSSPPSPVAATPPSSCSVASPIRRILESLGWNKLSVRLERMSSDELATVLPLLGSRAARERLEILLFSQSHGSHGVITARETRGGAERDADQVDERRGRRATDAGAHARDRGLALEVRQRPCFPLLFLSVWSHLPS